MIKTLRKVNAFTTGYRTHISNVLSLVGTGLAATGLGVDPQVLAGAVMGSADAINGLVNAWDASQTVNWGQVGIGVTLAVTGNVLSSVFRELGKKAK